jgi:hypothetical protein
VTTCLVTSFPSNLRCKHWPEAVPPKPDRFMAYIYTLWAEAEVLSHLATGWGEGAIT